MIAAVEWTWLRMGLCVSHEMLGIGRCRVDVESARNEIERGTQPGEVSPHSAQLFSH